MQQPEPGRCPSLPNTLFLPLGCTCMRWRGDAGFSASTSSTVAFVEVRGASTAAAAGLTSARAQLAGQERTLLHHGRGCYRHDCAASHREGSTNSQVPEHCFSSCRLTNSSGSSAARCTHLETWLCLQSLPEQQLTASKQVLGVLNVTLPDPCPQTALLL